MISVRMRGTLPLLFALLPLLATPLLAQEDDEEKEKPWQKDPYTENDPEAMKAAGYVSFGPFAWGDHHGTTKLEEVLGDVKMRWVETEHFRIGMNLGEYKPADQDERKKLRKELDRLEEYLPNLKASKVKKLDPWLRVHLYAMRCEELYDEISERLQVEQEHFPTGRSQFVNGKYMGEGPYLGMPEKFTLLLTKKKSTIGRYANRFAPGQGIDRPIRNLAVQTGSLMFGAATEMGEGSLGSDTKMHVHVVFNLTQNLMSGFKYYAYMVPLWIPEGMAHWQGRRVDPHHNNFSQIDEFGPNLRTEWNWEPKVRARVDQEYFPTTEKIAAWTDIGKLKFADHMMIWSRMDYLMTLGDEKFGTFFGEVKEPFNGVGGDYPEEDLVAHQQAAFEKVYGMTYAEFDEAWAKWVLKNYKRR